MGITFNSCKNKINKYHRKQCFEIFGFDFILDETFNVWLIEVNTNPCIEESSPLLAQLIPRMLDDAFRITVDMVFPGSGNKTNKAADFIVVRDNEEDKNESD
jgi:hypothetical protein